MKKSYKPLWINLVVSIIFTIGSGAWAIVMSVIDYEMKTPASVLAAIMLCLSLAYFFVIFFILLIKWANNRRKMILQYTETLSSTPQPKVPVNKRKLAFAIMIPIVMLALSIAFIFGINSDNLIISGIAAVSFILSLIGFAVVPKVLSYRLESKNNLKEEDSLVDTEDDLSKVSIDDQQELKTLWVMTSKLGRQYFMVIGYNCFYLVKLRLGMNPKDIVADDRLLQQKSNKKILFSDVVSFYQDSGIARQALGAVIKPMVVIKTVNKKYSLLINNVVNEEAILTFLTPIKHKCITREVQDRRERNSEISYVPEEASAKTLQICKRITLIASIISIVASILLFFFYFGAIIMFPVLSFFVVLGVFLGIFFNKYFSILEINQAQRRQQKRKKLKSGVMGIIFPSLISLGLRGLMHFYFVEMDKFLLYTLFVFIILAVAFLPLLLKSKQLKFSYMMLILISLFYSPSFIAYTNVAFYQSESRTSLRVEEKIYDPDSDYSSYRIKVTYNERQREFSISKWYYNSIEVDEEVTLIDIKGLYGIHHLIIDEV